MTDLAHKITFHVVAQATRDKVIPKSTFDGYVDTLIYREIDVTAIIDYDNLNRRIREQDT